MSDAQDTGVCETAARKGDSIAVIVGTVLLKQGDAIGHEAGLDLLFDILDRQVLNLLVRRHIGKQPPDSKT